MNREYWIEFYKEHWVDEKSSFADYCLSYINGYFTELGCGNGRDLYYFLSKGKRGIGVDFAFENTFILKQKIETFIRENKSHNCIYTRFLWHTIERELQLKILKWTKQWLFIEARTTEDKKLHKTFKHHNRNYVNTKQLLKDLEDNGFKIIKQEEGTGLAPYEKEDPYLIRLICKKLDKKYML